MISTIVLISLCCAGASDTLPYGEPYEMQGTRLVFANWHFIRAGSFSWLDRDGKPAYATKDFKFEADECRWSAGPNNGWGVRIRAYKPGEIRKPDIPLEKPWETQPISFDCVVEDNGVYKAWGSCGAPCYFESADGVHWQRPTVGLVEFQGSKENNLLPKLPVRNVFVDPSSETERYKCIYEAMIPQEEFKRYRQRRPDGWRSIAQREIDGKPMYCCLKGMVSKDGFTWEELPDPLVVDHTDTLNVGWFDARRKKYVIFVRTWNTFPKVSKPTAIATMIWLTPKSLALVGPSGSHSQTCMSHVRPAFAYFSLPVRTYAWASVMIAWATLFPTCLLESMASLRPSRAFLPSVFGTASRSWGKIPFRLTQDVLCFLVLLCPLPQFINLAGPRENPWPG